MCVCLCIYTCFNTLYIYALGLGRSGRRGGTRRSMPFSKNARAGAACPSNGNGGGGPRARRAGLVMPVTLVVMLVVPVMLPVVVMRVMRRVRCCTVVVMLVVGCSA